MPQRKPEWYPHHKAVELVVASKAKGTTWTEWWRSTKLGKRAFDAHVKALVEEGKVVRVGERYMWAPFDTSGPSLKRGWPFLSFFRDVGEAPDGGKAREQREKKPLDLEFETLLSALAFLRQLQHVAADPDGAELWAPAWTAFYSTYLERLIERRRKGLFPPKTAQRVEGLIKQAQAMLGELAAREATHKR